MVVSTDKVAYFLGRGRQKTKRCLHLQATDNMTPSLPLTVATGKNSKFPFLILRGKIAPYCSYAKDVSFRPQL